MAGLVATAETDIDAPPQRVWQAMTDPALIAQYMFGSEVVTDWQPGSSIVWQGEYEGKPYQDKGEILEVEPEQRLAVTHFSPLSGQDDVPENYHRIDYVLTGSGGRTHLALSQDGNGSEEEAGHAAETWQTMLDGLKKVAESS